MSQLWDRLQTGDVSGVEASLNDYLNRTISIRDTAVRRALKENFYHGLLVGLLSARDQWAVRSNSESGDGYSDIQVRDCTDGLAMVIEVKYADDGNLDAACRNAMEQIEEKRYADALYCGKYDRVLKYAIAFCLKERKVMLAR